MKIGTSGAFGNPERSPDLPVGEAFHVVQDDHGALPVSEMPERFREPLTQLARLRRIAKRDRDVVRQLVGISDLPPAHQIERGIRHDPVQPRPEWLVGAKPVERAVRVKESFLHRVLCVLVRQHDRANDTIGPALVQPDERGKRLIRPVLRRDDDRTLRRRPVNRCAH